MINLRLVYCAVLLLCSANLYAQSPTDLWARTYYGGVNSLGEGALGICEAGNGELVFVGTDYSTSAGNEFLITRLASDGDTLWRRTYGATFSEFAFSVVETDTNGYLVFAGEFGLPSFWPEASVWLYTSWGHRVTGRSYPMGLGTSFSDIVAVPGGWAMCGWHNDNTNTYPFLMRTNANFDTLWTRTFRGGYGAAKTIELMPDGGFLISCNWNSLVALIRTDAAGNEIWTRPNGAGYYNAIAGGGRTQNGQYYLAFTTQLCPGCDKNFALIRSDSNDHVLSLDFYGGPGDEICGAGIHTVDGGFLLVGESNSYSFLGDKDVYVVKAEADGDTIWTTVYGDTTDQLGRGVVQLADGGLGICGTSQGGSFVIRTEPYIPDPGEGCANSFTIATLPFTVSGSTAGHTNDETQSCPWSDDGAPDLAYTYTPAVDQNVTLSLCNSGFDTKLYVYENGAYVFAYACNDDACSDVFGNPYRSKIDCLPMYAGNTYCIVIDGYWDHSGPFTFQASVCAPCNVICSPTMLQEGEPLCGTGYSDNYNGGCLFSGQFATWINCGDSICGETGTYIFPPNIKRKDNDWYVFNLVQDCQITWSVRSSAPVVTTLWDGFCDPFNAVYPVAIRSANTGGCQTTSFQVPLKAGQYFVSVVPQLDSGIVCGTRYTAALSCICPYFYSRPFNDECFNATSTNVSPGSFIMFGEDNTNATRDCPANGYAELWYRINTTQTLDVTFMQCNTTPRWRSSPEWLWTSCPCGGLPTQMTFKSHLCSDGNYRIFFYDLPPGSYYYPVKSEDHMRGPYLLSIAGSLFQPVICPVLMQCPFDLNYGPANSNYWDAEWNRVSGMIDWAVHATGPTATTQTILHVSPQSCNLNSFTEWSSAPSTGACRMLAFDPRGGGSYWAGTTKAGTQPARLWHISNSGTVLRSWTTIEDLSSMRWSGGAFDADHNHLWCVVDTGDAVDPTSVLFELNVSNVNFPVVSQGPHAVPQPPVSRPMVDAGGADYIDRADVLVVLGNGFADDDYVLCLRDRSPNYSGPLPGPGFAFYDYCVPDQIGSAAEGLAVIDSVVGQTGTRMYLTGYSSAGIGQHPVYVYESCDLPYSASLVIRVSSTMGGARLNWNGSGQPAPLLEQTIYRVYRGNQPNVQPLPELLIATTQDTSYVDPEAILPGSLRAFYMVTREILPD